MSRGVYLPIVSNNVRIQLQTFQMTKWNEIKRKGVGTMKKRCIALLLAVTVSCGMLLSGCGSSSKNAADSNGTTNKTEEASSESTEEANTTSSADGVDYTQGDSYTIKIAHVALDITPIAKGMEKLKELIEEKSGGRVTVEIYPNSELGGNRELIEQLQMGTLEIASPSCAFLGGFTNGTALFDLPYLFDSQEGAFAVFDSEIGDNIMKGLETNGLVGLDWYAMGWRMVTCNNEVHKPEDMKGLKIRVMENQMHIDHFNALGCSATPMAFSEVYTSLQQGVIDAEENPYSQIYSQRFYEVQKYIIETKHIFDPTPVIMSKVWWDSLSETDQQMIRECSAEACEWERSIIQETDDEFKKELEGQVTIVELTDEERAAFREAAQPVYDAYEDQIGADVIAEAQRIQAEATAAAK